MYNNIKLKIPYYIIYLCHCFLLNMYVHIEIFIFRKSIKYFSKQLEAKTIS